MIRKLVVFWVAVTLASAADKPSEERDGIHYMMKDDFDSVLGDSNFAVFFHSPWTDHSSKVLFEFKKAAGVLQGEGVDMKFGVVDFSNNDYTGHRFGVNAGPAIKLFHSSKPYDYEGNFTYPSIVAAVQEHAQSDWTPPATTGKVVELETVEAFEAHISKEKLTLVEFYAPWCNHCQQLEPVLDKVASDLGKLDPPVPVVKVNAETNAALFTRYKMKGYPYVFVFKNGKDVLFEGPKNAPLMVDFVKQHMTTVMTSLEVAPSSAYIFSDTKKDTAVVGYFSSRSAYEYSMYSEVAEMYRHDKEVHFAHVIGSEAVAMAQKEFGFDSEDYGVVVLRDRRLPQKKGGKRYSVFAEDPFEKDALKTFIQDNRNSLVGYAANPDSFRKLFGRANNLTVVFMDIDWDPDTWEAMSYRLSIVAEVANKFPDMKFVALDHSELHSLKEHLGLGENDHDMSAAIFHEHKTRYPLSDECTVESLSAHVQDYLNGKELAKYFKSQSPPEKQTAPIKTLVRSTYDDVMADTTQDIAVVYTAGWSEDCRKFLPVLRKAHRLLDAKSVEFYKYDSSSNDMPSDVTAEKFPVLRLYPAGKDRMDSISTYSGPRNSNSMVNWIRENAATLQTEDDEEEETTDGHDEL